MPAALDPTLVHLIRSAVESPREEVPLAMLADELLARTDPVELRTGEWIRRWLSGDRLRVRLLGLGFPSVYSYRPRRGTHAHVHLGHGVRYGGRGAVLGVDVLLLRYGRVYRRPPLVLPKTA